MEIKSSEFVISAPNVNHCPNDIKAEYAFKQLTRRQKETYLRTHPSVTLPNGK